MFSYPILLFALQARARDREHASTTVAERPSSRPRERAEAVAAVAPLGTGKTHTAIPGGITSVASVVVL